MTESAFDMLMREYETVREQRDKLIALVCHVRGSEFDGITTCDVDGKNWFDVREEVLMLKKPEGNV